MRARLKAASGIFSSEKRVREEFTRVIGQRIVVYNSVYRFLSRNQLRFDQIGGRRRRQTTEKRKKYPADNPSIFGNSMVV